jgi:dolichol-phosphate mannosyltransferase
MAISPTLSIVIPIYNEEKNIFLLYERLCNVLSLSGESFELIFVNDGSRDNSMVLIKTLSEQDSRVKFIDFSRNFGHQVAVSAGLDYTQGEAVVIIDADLHSFWICTIKCRKDMK